MNERNPSKKKKTHKKNHKKKTKQKQQQQKSNKKIMTFKILRNSLVFKLRYQRQKSNEMKSNQFGLKWYPSARESPQSPHPVY